MADACDSVVRACFVLCGCFVDVVGVLVRRGLRDLTTGMSLFWLLRSEVSGYVSPCFYFCVCVCVCVCVRV